MGQEINDVLVATCNLLNREYGYDLVNGRWSQEAAVLDFLPFFRLLRHTDLLGDCPPDYGPIWYSEMDPSRPQGYLSVDDVRRGLRLGMDRMTGLTTLDVPMRLIIVTPRNRPEFNEDIARDWASSIFAGFRRRMIYADPDADPRVALLSEPTAQVSCQRIRGADAVDVTPSSSRGRDDLSVVIWELVWIAPVQVDPNSVPLGPRAEPEYYFRYLHVTDVPPEDLHDPLLWGDPEQILDAGPEPTQS